MRRAGFFAAASMIGLAMGMAGCGSSPRQSMVLIEPEYSHRRAEAGPGPGDRVRPGVSGFPGIPGGAVAEVTIPQDRVP